MIIIIIIRGGKRIKPQSQLLLAVITSLKSLQSMKEEEDQRVSRKSEGS